MNRTPDTSRPNLQLALGTVSFAICFAAWGLISAFAPRFREAFHITETQTAFLVDVPVLLGALLRIVTGMLADQQSSPSTMYPIGPLNVPASAAKSA